MTEPDYTLLFKQKWWNNNRELLNESKQLWYQKTFSLPWVPVSGSRLDGKFYRKDKIDRGTCDCETPGDTCKHKPYGQEHAWIPYDLLCLKEGLLTDAEAIVVMQRYAKKKKEEKELSFDEVLNRL